MSFTVHELPKARADKSSIFKWLHDRSPQGASSWLDAYDELLVDLKENAVIHGLAPENADCEFEVHQALFKTRRGRVYRALYFIEFDDVYVLRVRGPGQAVVIPDELK